MDKIGLGGGCHWCTEAVFQSLNGVSKVEQGFISPIEDKTSFSEAVIVHYDKEAIGLKDLLKVHLFTHNSTSNHSMRRKYRSAVYAFDDISKTKAVSILADLQRGFDEEIITEVSLFSHFKPSDKRFHNYYYSNPQKPFCETYIHPKLALLRERFSKNVDKDVLNTP